MEISSWGSMAVIILGYVFGAVFFIVRIYRAARQLRQDRLGMRGEQLVGYQLTELLRQGLHVVHDFPLDYGNIDHVVVGPTGVFAIETKFTRKVVAENDGHVIRYDGTTLHFPGSRATSRPIQQAQRQAADLSRLLEGLFGPVPVTPVLVYPGWYVNTVVSHPEVKVLNDKLLLSWIPDGARRLDAQTVERIASYLEDKCRDVEV